MSTSSRTFFFTLLLLVPLLVPALSCAGPQQSPFVVAGVSPSAGNNAGSGIVFSGPDIRDYRGTLLAFLYGRISGMVVDYASQPCPSVQLRGRKSLFGSSDPVVYVDGARAANSCVLEMLSTRDISRVEVYPMGVSNRPGYQVHPNGLILVFVLDGSVPGVPKRDRRSLFSDSG